MNILVISSLYPSESNPLSGIFVQSQAQELVKQGLQVKVLAPVPLAPFPLPLISKKWAGYQSVPQSDLAGQIEVHYPRYLSLPRNWSSCKSGQRMYTGLEDLLTKIAEDFPIDLIHAHVALPAGFAAMRAAEALKVPFLVTVHGGDLQRTIHFNQVCKVAVGEVFYQSRAVVLVSEKLKRLAEEEFGDGPHYIVLPNGIDPDLIVGFSKRQQASEGSHRTILSVSNLYSAKGLDLNLQAAKRLIGKHPDLKYQIIGAGPEKRYLKNLAKELGISNQVDFLGQLPHDQVMKHMANCDIFSLPSWQEGFGIVYLEAMAHGKPVIGCAGEGIEDFVVDSVTGFLVKPKDPDDLVGVLDNLLGNPHLGIQVGARAQQTVLENYTWEKNAQEMIRIYEECIDA